MVNPVSLRRRGVIPERSLPVTLEGYDLEFNGMANIAEKEGAVMHGVAHLVTPQMFEALARVESVYDFRVVELRPYEGAAAEGDADGVGGDGLAILARAFIMPPAPVGARQGSARGRGLTHLELPSERYVRIISEGLRHYGIDPAWVRRIEAQPFSPARQRVDWLTAPVADGPLPTYTAAELAQHKGKLPAVCALGCKVLMADIPPGHPFAPMYMMLAGSQAACYYMCLNLYDPSLPPIEHPSDMNPLHSAWAEDFAVEMALKYDFPLQQIGWLRGDGAAAADKGAAAGDVERGAERGAGGGRDAAPGGGDAKQVADAG